MSANTSKYLDNTIEFCLSLYVKILLIRSFATCGSLILSLERWRRILLLIAFLGITMCAATTGATYALTGYLVGASFNQWQAQLLVAGFALVTATALTQGLFFLCWLECALEERASKTKRLAAQD